MARIGIRLSVRTLLELVALAGVGVAGWRLAGESRPPGPEARALREGDEAERIAALRSLSLMGEAAADAIPALVATARDDPSPAARRGAAHALMRIAVADRGLGLSPASMLPIDRVLGPGLPRGGAAPGGPAPAPGPPRRLHPRAEVAAVNLAEVMRTAPDPEVRLYALRSLWKILDAAVQDRDLSRRTAPAGQPPPEGPESGPWVEAAARALAAQALDPDPQVSGHAVGFFIAARGREALPVDERIGTLLRTVESGKLTLPVEVMAVTGVAAVMNPDHPQALRVLDLLLDRAANPPEPAAIPGFAASEEQLAEAAQATYGAAAWRLVRSADDPRDRPELAALLLASLSGDEGADYPIRRGGMASWVFQSTERMRADQFEETANSRSASFSGGSPEVVEAHESALERIALDPRFLDDFWPRLGPRTRLAWLARGASFGPMRGGGWDRLLPVLADAGIVPDLPPGRCEAILSGLLDEPESDTGPAEGQMLQPIARQIDRDAGRRGEMQPTPAAMAEAREVRALHGLAVMAYFARGTSPGDPGVDRLVERLRGLLGSGQATTRSWAAWLLGSLGPSAAPALPDLEAMAASEADEATRDAAEVAIAAIRAGDADESPAAPREAGQ